MDNINEQNIVQPSENAKHIDERLVNFVERIENLEEEKAGIAEDLKQVYGEAKLEGYDPKVLRQLIKLKKMDQSERDEQTSLLDLYMKAIGM